MCRVKNRPEFLGIDSAPVLIVPPLSPDQRDVYNDIGLNLRVISDDLQLKYEDRTEQLIPETQDVRSGATTTTTLRAVAGVISFTAALGFCLIY